MFVLFMLAGILAGPLFGFLSGFLGLSVSGAEGHQADMALSAMAGLGMLPIFIEDMTKRLGGAFRMKEKDIKILSKVYDIFTSDKSKKFYSRDTLLKAINRTFDILEISLEREFRPEERKVLIEKFLLLIDLHVIPYVSVQNKMRYSYFLNGKIGVTPFFS